jgi:hypothetical protein
VGAAVGGAGCSPQPPLGGSLAGGRGFGDSDAAGRHGCAPRGDACVLATHGSLSRELVLAVQA